MNARKYLLYATSTATANTSDARTLEVNIRSAADAAEVEVRQLDDFSSIQGQICIGIEVCGDPDAVMALHDRWAALGLQIEDADQEIHELDGPDDLGEEP